MSKQDELASYVEQLLDVQEALEPLKAREADLKAKIKETAGMAGVFDMGEHRLTLSPQRRLDMDAITEQYPASQHPELYALSPEAKKVRAHLAPADVDRFMVESGELRVSVR